MMVCFPGYGPSFSVPLFCSVGKVPFRTGRGPAAQSASILFALWLWLPRSSCQCPWPSDPLADIFVAQMQSASGALSLHKLSVQEILGDLAIIHSDYRSEPAQASLLQQCEGAEDFSSLQDSVVGDFVLPLVGVWISNNLSWHKQVIEQTARANKLLGYI